MANLIYMLSFNLRADISVLIIDFSTSSHPRAPHTSTPTSRMLNHRQTSSSFKLPEQLRLWLESELNLDGASAARPIRPKSIIVEGHSRTGKTQWARSLGRHSYLCGHLDFNSKCYSNDAVYNVIDDIGPNYLKMKHWKELLGAQLNWQTNCKYRKPVLIKGGIPSIILCNPGPESSYHEFLEKPENRALKDWTLLNCEFVFLKGPLY
ncbi:hypothetical protein SESBI_40559 [Sesbania bispinosa]|nr:hypothetical protein SESBI_40559 [Sesbania bispinosa]